MAEPTIIVIKKVKGGHGHHGGAWKVAYADFVTAMMALFMVLWLLSQTDQSEREQISVYFRTGVLSGGKGLTEGGGDGSSMGGMGEKKHTKASEENYRLTQEAKKVRKRLEQAMAGDKSMGSLGDNVRVEVTTDGLMISILERDDDSLIFDLASASIKPALSSILEELAPVLGAMPNKIRIDGHTDAKPYSQKSSMTNWELSFHRADQAREVLQAHGLKVDQISGVYARGSSQLLVPDNPLAPENRRLTILAMREHIVQVDTGSGPTGEASAITPKPASADHHEGEHAPAEEHAPADHSETHH